MLRFEDLRVRDSQTLDRDFFNRRFRLIAESLGQIDAEVTSVASDTDRLVALGLSRVNEVLGPLLAQLQAASELGFLVAESHTPVTVALDLETTFEIAEPYRGVFAPTSFLMLQRKAPGTMNDFAAIELQGYNRSNGGLAGKVVLVNGTIGSAEHSDWVISVAAGVSTGVVQALIEMTTNLGVLSAVAAEATAAIAAVNTLIASGAVASVNGKTGAVALGIGDIPNLTNTIAAKADSNHGHTVAQIDGLQSTLNAFADGGAY